MLALAVNVQIDACQGGRGIRYPEKTAKPCIHGEVQSPAGVRHHLFGATTCQLRFEMTGGCVSLL